MKIMRIVGIVAAIIIIVGLISIPIINNQYAHSLEEKLCEIPLPKNTEFIESISKAGKLNGNGNGMQYFGAILIKSEFSLQELEIYYSNYRSNQWDCLVEVQNDNSIKEIEHELVCFNASVSDTGYYIVYSWGSNNSIFDKLDIRGH